MLSLHICLFVYMIVSFPKCFVRPTERDETDKVKNQSACFHVYAWECIITKLFGMAGCDRVAYRSNRQLNWR